MRRSDLKEIRAEYGENLSDEELLLRYLIPATTSTTCTPDNPIEPILPIGGRRLPWLKDVMRASDVRRSAPPRRRPGDASTLGTDPMELVHEFTFNAASPTRCRSRGPLRPSSYTRGPRGEVTGERITGRSHRRLGLDPGRPDGWGRLDVRLTILTDEGGDLRPVLRHDRVQRGRPGGQRGERSSEYATTTSASPAAGDRRRALRLGQRTLFVGEGGCTQVRWSNTASAGSSESP